MVFRQVGNDTDKLINKFGILNKSFANIKMDFQNGQGVRSFGNIVSKQDVANFEKFQQDLKDGISYHKAFNNNLANSHTYIQQQAVRLRELNIQQKLLDRQLKTNKISQEEYNASMTANKAQITALTTQTQTFTFAQKASAVASKFMGTALKTALNIGLMLLINAIITEITKLVNKQKELAEAAKQSAQETSEYIDSLDGLKERYLEIVDSENSVSEKTQELNKFKQELVETYGFEKDIIDKLNLSREHGIELLDEEAQKQAKAKRNEFYAQNKNVIDDTTNYFKSRGLDKTINKYSLGYNKDGFNSAFKDHKELNFYNDTPYKYFIPLPDSTGKVRSFIVRAEDGASVPKVRNIKGLKIMLLNQGYLENKIDDKFIYLCEGWADSLSIEEFDRKSISLNSTSNERKLIELIKKNKKNYILPKGVKESLC